MTNGDPVSCSSLFLFYLFQNKLPEVPEYAKMQFHMMTLLEVLGKIAWVRLDFLSQGKISDILIKCARKVLYLICTGLCYIYVRPTEGRGDILFLVRISSTLASASA